MLNIQIEEKRATKTNASDIYVVQGTNGADDGVKRLIELMGKKGTKFYKAEKKDTLQGPEGLFSSDDVVIIKVNSQWNERGGTNTDLVKSIIQALTEHPDGFKGEVIIADNGQAQYGSTGHGGSLDYERNNAIDQSQSNKDVADSFKDTVKASIYLWDDISSNVVGEYGDGDDEDGYVVNTNVVADTGTIVSYPKFTTEYGTKISFKHGVYDPERESYYSDKLKVINVPVLKCHFIYGVTAAVKHYMGVPSDKLTAKLGYRIHQAVAKGGMGTMLAETRIPTINLLDCIHINAKPNSGPRSDYTQATEVNIIAASLDPFALDYYASKNILIPVSRAVYNEDTAIIDPDNREPNTFGKWFKLAYDAMKASGYKITIDEDQMNVYLAS